MHLYVYEHVQSDNEFVSALHKLDGVMLHALHGLKAVQ